MNQGKVLRFTKINFTIFRLRLKHSLSLKALQINYLKVKSRSIYNLAKQKYSNAN